MKYLLVALAFLVVSTISCSKNNNAQTGPVITVTSPTSNQQFSASKTITVSDSIAHTTNIREVKLRV